MDHMDTDGPLDFEFEDPLLTSDDNVAKRRTKTIGLDDLLTDYFKEQSKVIERQSKRAKALKDHDESGVRQEVMLKSLEECEFKINEIGCGEEEFTWGMQVFGNQKSAPPLVFPELGSNSLLQSVMNNQVNSLVKLTVDAGEGFFEGLLLNGWFSQLVGRGGRLEKSVAQWIYHLMFYSQKEELRTAACKFWCTAVQLDVKDNKQPTGVEWFPSYSDLKTAIEIYGFVPRVPLQGESPSADNDNRGPPDNIQTWIKFTAACCQARGQGCMFLASEAETLLEVIVLLSLDRKLEGFLLLLHDCVQSVINYFTDEEWQAACQSVARSLACRVPKDLNCIRALESIPGISPRANSLRAAVSHQLLHNSFDKVASDEEGILSCLIAINMAERECDLFKMYIYLSLAENWLLSTTVLEDKPLICEMWGVYLRHCTCQISHGDLRPYAAKIRAKATYLLHSKTKKY
ncbi:unnamed protein product [Linum tenue]|uniref:Coiled-coil SMC6 And NSE5 INteracting (CANIN) domain-containing protein n=1 Tax=Linum tenue TaxID=586396 RepID=A0AAV0IKT2_9ROSI|nr:unnamed protein product [Linum tenue]